MASGGGEGRAERVEGAGTAQEGGSPIADRLSFYRHVSFFMLVPCKTYGPFVTPASPPTCDEDSDNEANLSWLIGFSIAHRITSTSLARWRPELSVGAERGPACRRCDTAVRTQVLCSDHGHRDQALLRLT